MVSGKFDEPKEAILMLQAPQNSVLGAEAVV